MPLSSGAISAQPISTQRQEITTVTQVSTFVDPDVFYTPIMAEFAPSQQIIFIDPDSFYSPIVAEFTIVQEETFIDQDIFYDPILVMGTGAITVEQNETFVDEDIFFGPITVTVEEPFTLIVDVGGKKGGRKEPDEQEEIAAETVNHNGEIGPDPIELTAQVMQQLEIDRMRQLEEFALRLMRAQQAAPRPYTEPQATANALFLLGMT